MHSMPLAPQTRRTPWEEVRVADLMTSNPISLRHDLTVRDAAMFLYGREIDSAPVVNDAGRAVGVLSLSDVILAVNAGVDMAPVREVMTPTVIAMTPEATIRDVTDIMVRQMVRRVYVIDDDGVPIGVVSATDLVRALSGHWSTQAVAI